jgi:D-3-phosphoglycerate dehydrogenase
MPETILDLRGLRCPLPALKTRKALTRLAAGDLLVVECTDPLSTIDIPNLINQTGDTLEESKIESSLFVFRIKKAGAQEGDRRERDLMPHRCAILDDYQNVALKLADWSIPGVEVKVFNEHFPDIKTAVAALKGFDIICMMRERTPFLKATLEQLPDLKLLLTSGARNASIDLDTAAERGITVCGTGAAGQPTAELAIGIMLELARKIGYESNRMKQGVPWQSTLGIELAGKTLGLLGFGKLGGKVGEIAKAIGMNLIAWSENLTAEKARAGGATLVSKQELFQQSDFLSVHLVLSPRSRGLVGAKDLALMKPTAFLINTSRGPIVDEPALLSVLGQRRIAGAGLDTFDVEPLPVNHPLRKLDNVVLTPHLGYVSQEGYKVYFTDMVENIKAWLAGKPVRVIKK